MVAMLWVKQILSNDKKFIDVPRMLKDEVKTILKDLNRTELITDTE